MTGPTPYSDNLREFIFSNQPGLVVLDTLEFNHPAFLDGDNQPTAARVVNDADDFYGQLEANAPMNGGEVVKFLAARFELTLPESNGPGLPSCQIAVDNIGRLLMDPIERAVQVPAPIMITYRHWLASKDAPIEEPGELGVVIDGMSLRRVNASELRITGTAGFEDDLNTPFPRKNYTREEYPGLVR